MATKEKVSVYQRLRTILFSAAFSIAGMCTFATTTVVLTTSHAAAASGPICAILDQGQVQCPTTITASGCYYKDLGNPDPSGNVAKTGYVKAADCSNGIFQQAACPPNAGTCNLSEGKDPALSGCTGNNCDLVKAYVDPLINVLAAAVGVVVTISIVIGGIQYSSSAGDPGKMQAAKQRIINALIALIGFFLFYAVLQWLVPGGLLNG
jgi:hypothetical protein